LDLKAKKSYDSTVGAELNESEPSEKPSLRVWPGGHVLRLDLRSLATVRMAYGIIIFLDTLVRWTDLVPFYSDYGALPRRSLLDLGWNEHWFSLHMASGNLLWTNFLFLVQAAAALALLLGWHTRLATLISWILMISIHARNPMVLNGGDIYLRVFLFWMLFLPTGHRWSMDAKEGRGDHYKWMPDLAGNSLYGMSALAVLIQVGMVYWFAALPKTDPSWTATFTATELALHLDQFVTPIGLYFRDTFTEHLALLTSLVILWEFWGPFLLFFPFDRGQVRILGIFGFTALHTGFGMMMELGFFAWTGALTPLILLPAWFWDSPMKFFSKWADRRFGVGPPAQGDPKFKWPRELLFIFLTLYCFAWNLGNENLPPHGFRVPDRLKVIASTLRLDQRWNMFSPGPLTEDGWFVIDGQFRDGQTGDLFKNGEKVTWDKPKDVVNTYKNQRWRKYMMNLWLAENSKYRLPFGQYLCRKWNRKERRTEELVSFDIVYMLEVTNLDGTVSVPEKRVIWNHWCFDKPADQNASDTAEGFEEHEDREFKPKARDLKTD
jgi:hypothetical protein